MAKLRHKLRHKPPPESDPKEEAETTPSRNHNATPIRPAGISGIVAVILPLA
jgi:hypothetical protein